MDVLVRVAADGALLVIVIVAGIVGVYHFVIRHRELFTQAVPLAIMAGLTSLLIGKMMSLVYQPSTDRPYIQQGVSAGASYIDNPGFPSDHVLLGAVIVLMLWALTPYRRVVLALTAILLVMAAGRVAALVHAPIDIVGGVIAALVGGVWYIKYRKHDK